jgi:hypothetical protein
MNKMSDMSKTTKEWFNELPDGYRERAIANTTEGILETRENSIVDAFYRSFTWDKSPEGHRFWKRVKDHYAYDTPIPPLP